MQVFNFNTLNLILSLLVAIQRRRKLDKWDWTEGICHLIVKYFEILVNTMLWKYLVVEQI